MLPARRGFLTRGIPSLGWYHRFPILRHMIRLETAFCTTIVYIREICNILFLKSLIFLPYCHDCTIIQLHHICKNAFEHFNRIASLFPLSFSFSLPPQHFKNGGSFLLILGARSVKWGYRSSGHLKTRVGWGF